MSLVLLMAPLALHAAPKNVLLLISDNHCAADLGCYGHPNIRTPNLDALATRGTRFLNAFATVSSCGPSRAVIYSGLLTHANGQYTHAHSFHNGVLARDVRPVFDIVKAGGYRTALFGKTSFTPLPGQYELDLISELGPRDIPGMVLRAEEFIRSSGDQPFLVALCTHDPHPQEKSPAQRQKLKPSTPRTMDPATLQLPSYVPDRPDVRESFAEYYELVERLSHVMHEVTMYYPMRTLRERRYKLIWNLSHQTPFLNAKEVAERSPWRLTIERGEKFIGKRTVEKYIWRDPVELYDLQTDPDEVVNLAADPAYSGLRRSLSERLLQRLRETNDYWLERYQLPMPGETVNVALPPPQGYAPPRKGKAEN
jgi:arylsulfatase A-like enzyme